MKVFKVSSLTSKIVALFMVLVTITACTGVFIRHILYENKALAGVNAQLQEITAEQQGLIREKAGEIKNLKEQEAGISGQFDEFAQKYREIIDKYISSRAGSSRTDRSDDRGTGSFMQDLDELKGILENLNELGKLGGENSIDLSETEAKLSAYLNTIPTLWPASGRISSAFGTRRDPINGRKTTHEGLDIAASYGDSIKASASGTVIMAEYYSGYGRAVIIDHGRGITTLYGHASKLLVKEGQNVEKGNVIAKVGSSGRSTGAHLHFEVRINGEQVDPQTYLDKK